MASIADGTKASENNSESTLMPKSASAAPSVRIIEPIDQKPAVNSPTAKQKIPAKKKSAISAKSKPASKDATQKDNSSNASAPTPMSEREREQREKLERSIRERVALEKQAFELQQALLDAEASQARVLLEQARQLLQPQHFDDVCEERALAGQCGWPACARALPSSQVQSAGPRFRIAAAQRRVYETEARRRFCCDECARTAAAFQAALDPAPVATRSATRAIPPVRVMPHDTVDAAPVPAPAVTSASASAPAPAPASDSVAGTLLRPVREAEASVPPQLPEAVQAAAIEGYVPRSKPAAARGKQPRKPAPASPAAAPAVAAPVAQTAAVPVAPAPAPTPAPVLAAAPSAPLSRSTAGPLGSLESAAGLFGLLWTCVSRWSCAETTALLSSRAPADAPAPAAASAPFNSSDPPALRRRLMYEQMLRQLPLVCAELGLETGATGAEVGALIGSLDTSRQLEPLHGAHWLLLTLLFVDALGRARRTKALAVAVSRVAAARDRLAPQLEQCQWDSLIMLLVPASSGP